MMACAAITPWPRHTGQYLEGRRYHAMGSCSAYGSHFLNPRMNRMNRICPSDRKAVPHVNDAQPAQPSRDILFILFICGFEKRDPYDEHDHGNAREIEHAG